MGDHLKPQDVLVALKLFVQDAEAAGYEALANELDMSKSEVHGAVKRLTRSRLYSTTGRRIARRNLLEFLAHGVAYVFPAEEGALASGLPTAWSAAPLAGRLVTGDEDRVVWPTPEGTVQGHALAPLYRSAPKAAAKDPRLYELLALVDALRAGRARERKLARDEIERRLLP